MATATIQSVSQTEKAGLFTICFEGESYTEFQKFITKNDADVELQPDLQEILRVMRRMVQKLGFLERLFRPEGKMSDRVAAIPVSPNKLRLYCLRLSDGVLIVGNGGQKKTRTYDESNELVGYVLTLQKLDALLKAAERKGTISIEKTTITGLDNKNFRYMKHAVETERLFLKVTDETPDEIKLKVDWSLDISTAIDDALHKKRMTQKELAARLGTSPASVHSWLGGTHNFTLSTLARISAVLGVPLISVVK